MVDDEVPLYQQRGDWVQCGITGMGFPKEPTEVQFRGHRLFLLPARPQGEDSQFGELYPVVALERGGLSFEDGQRVISSFINSVAWVRKKGIGTAQFAGGSALFGLGGPDARALIDEHFALDYVPEPNDDKANLALAFYREGLTLNSTAYQCLSFFKILNITLANPKSQISWIDANIEEARKLDPVSTKDWEKHAGIDPNQDSPGEYLYASNRCAIAHAFGQPLIDPDNPLDRRRLANDLPMVKALAEYFIEHEFGVKSRMTVWREHLYELEGFTTLFGPDLVARVKAGEEVPLAEFPPLPSLSVRLAFNDVFPVFEGMRSEVVDCANGVVNLALSSNNQLSSVLLVLNFAEERLDFEILHHMAITDDGTTDGAKAMLDWLRFLDTHLGNGKFEVWSAGKRLSRKDAFLPTNVDLTATHANYQAKIAAAENALKSRGG